MRKPTFVLFTIGAILFGTAVAYHIREILILDQLIGPGIALLLDGIPALGIAYAAYRLEQTDLPEPDRWRTVAWSVAGALVFISVIALTFLVLLIESRRIPEPIFLVLITAEIGALSGMTAGYYYARVHAETRRITTVNKAVAFVNDLIRHDLRNDLSVIQGQASRLDSGAPENDAPAEMSIPTVIEEKTEEALTRIETTRAITETLVGDPEFEPVDLSRITKELASKLEDVFPVTVNTRLPDAGYVWANAGVRSIVDNVLENAAGHNDADDPRIDVEIERRDAHVVLRVSDNGPGIPEDEIPGLFEAQEGELEAQGLTLVHTLVDAYNGQIRIENNTPRGTVVIIQLPRAEPTEGAISAGNRDG